MHNRDMPADRFESAYQNAVDIMFPAGAPDTLTLDQHEAATASALAEVAAES